MKKKKNRFFENLKKRFQPVKGFGIKVTKTGYIFFAFTLGIGFAGLNTGNNLLYLVFAMMLSFLILSGLLSNQSLKGIRVQPIIQSRIHAQTPKIIRLVVRNKKKRFPSFSLQLKSDENSSLTIFPTFVAKVDPESRIKTDQTVIFSQRGEQIFPDLLLETSFPFGLLKKFLLLSTEQKVLVLPKLMDLESFEDILSETTGDARSKGKGYSDNPFGVREFQYGDSYKKVHWKSSAKFDSLRVKEFEVFEKDLLTIHLVLEPTKSEELEKAISFFASLSQYLAERQIPFQSMVQGELLNSQGQAFDRTLSYLALLDEKNLEDPRQIKHVESDIVITNILQFTNENVKKIVRTHEFQKYYEKKVA